MMDIPHVFLEFNYIILTLYVDSDEQIKHRILARKNGNLYKDWKQSVKINATIRARKKLPNEYRILNVRDDADLTLHELLNIIAEHQPETLKEIPPSHRDDFFTYIDQD